MNTRRNKNVKHYFIKRRERSREKDLKHEDKIEYHKIILQSNLKLPLESLIENEIKKKYYIIN
jgi:hypothetical protein